MPSHHIALIVFCFCSFVSAQAQRPDKAAANLSPNPDRFKVLESNPDDHPVVLLRLLRYKSGTDRSAYRKLLEQSVPVIHELGGEILFYGTATPVEGDVFERTQLFGWRPNPWDVIVLEKYPSRKHVRMLGESENDRNSLYYQQDDIEDMVLYAFNGTRRPRDGITSTVAEINRKPDDPTPAVYMLNLLKFTSGGEKAYFENYGSVVTPIIVDRHHGKIVYGLKAEQVLIGEEVYDRAILVMYPSIEEFTSMILSEDYQRIAHYREDAVEIGHLYPNVA